MATTSAPRVNGVNPSNRGKNVASDPLTDLQSLWKAVHEISKDDGFSRFTMLFERVNAQEASLKDRDGKINELETRLAAQEASHSAHNNEQFDDFEKRYQKWEKQKEELRSGMESLTAASKEKDKTITTLQEELKKAKARVVDLEKSHDAMMKSNNNKNIQLGDLDVRLQTALNMVNEQKAQLKKADDNVVTLTKSFESKVNENQKLQEDAARATDMIREYKRFTVKIEKLDMPKVTGQLESLWESVAVILVDTIGRDLPTDVLERDWTKLNDNKWFNHIPLPQNNSNIAKQMRVAVVLGALARLVVKFLFQPTYVLDECSGLRQLLRHQATINPIKERYTRGIILSMPHDDQKELDLGIIVSIVENLEERVDILFPTKDDFTTFAEELEELLFNFQEHWKHIQRGKEKLEPSLDGNPSPANYPWYIVDLPVAADGKKRTSSPPTTTDAQDDTIIVPQVVLIRPEGDPEPVTRGWVLQNAHIHAAEEERAKIRKTLRTNSFAEETQDRPRNRPRRGMSISASTQPDRRKSNGFLP